MWSTALRNITAQRKNILDTGILILFYHRCNVLTGRGNTGQMGQNGNIILLLEICRDVDRVFARAAACTVMIRS